MKFATFIIGIHVKLRAATLRSRSASGSRSGFRTAFPAATSASAATAISPATAISRAAVNGFRDHFDRDAIQFCVIQVIQSIIQCSAVTKFNDTLSLFHFVRIGIGDLAASSEVVF